jgi:CO/xanthine dehydrogenase Mo-binding subunit
VKRMSEATTAVMNFPRRDARDKLRGRTRYTVDRSRPGMLHAAMARAQVPSARIVRIDTSGSRRMPGVRAIVTGADAPFRYGIGIADHPLFAIDRIRHDGEPIAAVAADTQAQAEAAAAAIAVELEPLPAVITMAEALAPDAPLVHPDWKNYEVMFEGGARGDNVAWEATVVRGDVDAAFARDDVKIVESSFRVGRQNHLSLEPRAVIASYEDGRFHIETSTQVPWSIKNAAARFLNLPPSSVRVTVPPVGGGFGLKFDWALEPFAALLARATGRPVRLISSRQEEMLTCLCRENADIVLRSAVTRDGEIVGREAVVLMNCGAYGGEQIFRTTMTAHTLGGKLPTWLCASCQPRGLHQHRAQRRIPRLQRRVQHVCARTPHRRNLRRDRHGAPGIPAPQRLGQQRSRRDRPSLRGRCSQTHARSHA